MTLPEYIFTGPASRVLLTAAGRSEVQQARDFYIAGQGRDALPPNRNQLINELCSLLGGMKNGETVRETLRRMKIR